MTDPDQMQNLQEKIAYLELRVSDLEAALDREAGDNVALSARLDVVERALSVLASRQKRGEGEVLGANSEDDPVPHSG